MSYSPDPDFQALYEAYTANPDSIGAHLNARYGELSSEDPLLVTTGSDMVIFPGGGRPPLVESFRKTTRGFIEITAVSHLGVAVPYLIQLKDLDQPNWRRDADRLIERAARVRAMNSVAYWRDVAAVEAWRGREEKITALVDYSCAATIDAVERGLSDPERFTMEWCRDHFLDRTDPADLPVAMNDMMAATFALVFLDTGFRVSRWLREQAFDWTRLMVIITGRAGRPTAGLTWQTNSMCHLLWRASGERLDPDKLYIAPHAPVLGLDQLSSPEGVAEAETQFRQVWFSTRTTAELGRLMYRDYPAFQRRIEAAPVVDATTETLAELPTVRSGDDRRAYVTRLRFVMEDPGQQLANAGAQFIIDQLAGNGNRPEAVVVPGFDGIDYPEYRPSA